MNTLFNKVLGENERRVFYFYLKPNELFDQPNIWEGTVLKWKNEDHTKKQCNMEFCKKGCQAFERDKVNFKDSKKSRGL